MATRQRSFGLFANDAYHKSYIYTAGDVYTRERELYSERVSYGKMLLRLALPYLSRALMWYVNVLPECLCGTAAQAVRRSNVSRRGLLMMSRLPSSAYAAIFGNWNNNNWVGEWIFTFPADCRFFVHMLLIIREIYFSTFKWWKKIGVLWFYL